MQATMSKHPAGTIPVRRAVAAVLLGLVLMLAGCGGDDDDASETESTGSESSSTTDTSEDTEADGSGSEVDIGDFPVPAPPGGELVAEGGSGQTLLITYPVSEYDAIVAFYEDWVSEVSATDDPPPTIASDDADHRFGATVQATDIGLVQIIALESDGELALTIAVLGPA